jgi:hypothetical protein
MGILRQTLQKLVFGSKNTIFAKIRSDIPVIRKSLLRKSDWAKNFFPIFANFSAAFRFCENRRFCKNHNFGKNQRFVKIGIFAKIGVFCEKYLKIGIFAKNGIL